MRKDLTSSKSSRYSTLDNCVRSRPYNDKSAPVFFNLSLSEIIDDLYHELRLNGFSQMAHFTDSLFGMAASIIEFLIGGRERVFNHCLLLCYTDDEKDSLLDLLIELALTYESMILPIKESARPDDYVLIKYDIDSCAAVIALSHTTSIKDLHNWTCIRERYIPINDPEDPFLN